MRKRLIGCPAASVLEMACWGLGAALIASYFGARAYGELERQQAIATFTEARSLVAAEADLVQDAYGATSAGLEYRTPDQTRWSESRIRAYTAAAATVEMPGLPAALLRIRQVKLEVPVYADTGERNLNRGAGLVAGSAPPGSDGNVAIAAHRDGYFRVLEHVEVGDVIELDGTSWSRSYRVTELYVVEPTDISPLRQTGVPAITLVTCYPFYFIGSAPQRYIVQAVALE